MVLSELVDLLRKTVEAEKIDEKRDEILSLIPKAKIMVGFDQQNWAH